MNKDLVSEIKKDFEYRAECRRALEAKWLLNLNFNAGNQYSELNSKLDIVDYGKRFPWESREVYNHIAPIVENRLAKFTRVNCSVVVRPASAEEDDVDSSKLATKLIEATFHDNNFIAKFNEANYWAELTGTVFYKVGWNRAERTVTLEVCPPYEIYPDNLSSENFSDLESVIRAKAYPVKVIEESYGKKVKGRDMEIMDGGQFSTKKGVNPRKNGFFALKKDYQMVIERYVRPTKDRPEGRLTIIAGDTLLHDGPLPFRNGLDGKRDFPFVKQVAFPQPCSFFGTSVIERLIPVQRAYNAVKNRKHEYMARLSIGVLAVEDGSVDLDSLREEGLEPGRVLVYRQGSTPPLVMNPGVVPQEFRDEEDRLLMEFRAISGVSDGVELSQNANSTISGYALSLLIEQDYNRLSVTTESIRTAVKEIAKKVLRLYKSNLSSPKLLRVSGENGEPEVRAFKSSMLLGEDVVMESDSTMIETPATRKNMVLELLNYGLLGDENGVISNRNRAKIVEMLGFGSWESARSDDEVHLKKAGSENISLTDGECPKADELDDHDLHVQEHVGYLVSKVSHLSDGVQKAFHEHIRRHKILKDLEKRSEK